MFEIERKQEGLIVSLKGELTFFNSSEIKEKIKAKITGDEKKLFLELSGLEMIDSSGVGVVLSLLKKMAGKEVIVVAPQAKVARVFEITRLDQIVPILPTLEQAFKI